MEFTRWPETHQNPPPPLTNPNPSSIDHHLPFPTSNYYQYLPSENRNPTITAPESLSSFKPHEHYATAAPIDHAIYASAGNAYVQSQSGCASGSYEYGCSDSERVMDASTVSSDYYSNSNVGNWAAKEAIRLYGADAGESGVGVTVPSTATAPLHVRIANSILWTTPFVQHPQPGTWKKHVAKTKVVQSAYCEICKVDCNSKDVLEQHKLGKKHKKFLEKLKEETVPSSTATIVSKDPLIGPQEEPKKVRADGVQKSRKKRAQVVEDLETKRRKVVEGGAAADAIRTCAICNVVCNSETVFSFHLAGQKHAAMVKRYMARGVATRVM